MANSSNQQAKIYESVVQILVKVLHSPHKARISQKELTMETDVYTDLGMDSVEALDFLTAIENEFDINPDQFEANQRRTIGQIIDYVIQLIREKRGSHGDKSKKG